MADTPYLVLGGTFDPVHDGHLAIARAARARFGGSIHFIPAGDPAHRSNAQASALHRLAMLQIAIARERGFAIDTRELSRDGPSWTIDTVEELRQELPPDQPLVLVIGMDSLRAFTTWKRWRDILAQAHLQVFTRPGQGMPTARELGDLAEHVTANPDDLLASNGGLILIETSTAVNMAATRVRAEFDAGRVPEGLPPGVGDYIQHHRLYRHDDTVPSRDTPDGATKKE